MAGGPRLAPPARRVGGGLGPPTPRTHSSLRPPTRSSLRPPTHSSLRPPTHSTLRPPTRSTLRPPTRSTLRPLTPPTPPPPSRDQILGELRYLDKAVSFVLAWVGAKMIYEFAAGAEVPTAASLGVVVVALGVGVGASLLLPEGGKEGE